MYLRTSPPKLLKLVAPELPPETTNNIHANISMLRMQHTIDEAVSLTWSSILHLRRHCYSMSSGSLLANGDSSVLVSSKQFRLEATPA